LNNNKLISQMIKIIKNKNINLKKIIIKWLTSLKFIIN
jgi:hypothetical protein